MAVPVTNFGLVTVSTGYAAGATSIVLQAGDGSRLPSTFPYPMTWWNNTQFAHPADDPFREIVSVVNRVADTLTIVRAQEGTTASSKNNAGSVYRMSLGITEAMWSEMRGVRNTHQGVVLQTSRSAVSEKTVVELAACEYLVMDDGVVLRNDNDEWTGKTATITASGAGGLDTGAEISNAWYDIYAIATEAGARSLLLHRSKSWNIGAAFEAGEDASQAVRSTASNTIVAQGIVLTDAGGVPWVNVKLKRVGSPVGQLFCVIYADSGGVPGAIVASAYALDVSRLPTTATWVRVTFPTPLVVLSGPPTKYHIGVGGSWTVDGVNYVEWRMDGSAATYASGSKAIWNGSAWVLDTDDDMQFLLAIEVNNSAVVLPATYTKKCLLGWVYNDSGSDFVAFLQQGRTRRNAVLKEAQAVIAVLDGSTQIINADALVPLMEGCTVELGVGGTGTAAAVVAVGDVRATDVSETGDTVGAQTVLVSGTTATKPTTFKHVIVQRNTCMVKGTPGAKIWLAGFSW